MGIRKADLSDAAAISALINQLDYPGSQAFIESKMQTVLGNPFSALIVYEMEQKAIAFMVIEFLPQLGLKGDIARIGYFAVDAAFRGKGIGDEMEEYITTLAKEKGCNRIEVHCHERRKDAHRFYYRQGYVESPKYLMKMLE